MGNLIGQENGDIRGGWMQRRARFARVHLNIDIRVRGAKAREPWNEQLAGEERWQQHAERVPASAPRHVRESPVEGLEQRLDFVEECMTGCREIDGASPALEQPHAQSVFQLFHLMAHGGRCQEQLVGRDFEAATTRSDAERSQVPQWRRTGQSHGRRKVWPFGIAGFCNIRALGAGAGNRC